jgi:toxin CcdB
MARFDVYEGEGGGYLLDCQADILSDLKTRFVVPLVPAQEVQRLAAKLNPTFEIGGGDYVMATNLAATVPASMLSRRVTSLRAEDGAIGNAIDMLLFGF